jgi:2-polyprenyl-3-methyl-5-hydroxy-6-metoxy-1,4-benzoquinol methylase
MQKDLIEKIMSNIRPGGGQRVSYRFVLNRLKGNEKILDVGCGYGIFDEQCKQNGLNICGIDPYDRTDEPSFRYICDDFITHEFNERFDVIISLSAIEHFGMDTYNNKRIDDDAPRKALEKMTKLADKVIITIPVGSGGDSHWFRCFDEKRLNKLLSGFNIVEKIFVACNNNWRKWNVVSKERAFRSKWLKSKIPSALVCFVISVNPSKSTYNETIINTLDEKNILKNRNYFSKVINHILNKKPSSLLEIGCGKGHLLDIIANKIDAHIVGIDIISENFESDYVYENTLFEDYNAYEKFDMVVCLNVLHYVFNLCNFIEKITKHMNENGEFYGCVPKISENMHKMNLNLFTTKNLRLLLSFYFKNVEIEKYNNLLFFRCSEIKNE